LYGEIAKLDKAVTATLKKEQREKRR